MKQQRFALEPLDLEGRAKIAYCATLAVLIAVGWLLFFTPEWGVYVFAGDDLSIDRAVELLQMYPTYGGYCFLSAILLMLGKRALFCVMNDYRNHLSRSHEGRRHHC